MQMVGAHRFWAGLGILDSLPMTDPFWATERRRASQMRSEQHVCPVIGDSSRMREISDLTQKHAGNVHDQGIVTITSKSVSSDSPETVPVNVADLTTSSDFLSDNTPDQWICWDFGEMRVRPTHYTIQSFRLKFGPGRFSGRRELVGG
jgi:hypothetical protein